MSAAALRFTALPLTTHVATAAPPAPPARLNYGHRQPDGAQLTHTHWIRPGWQLQIPVPAHTAEDGADSRGQRDYTVKRGGTLWEIADSKLAPTTATSRSSKTPAASRSRAATASAHRARGGGFEGGEEVFGFGFEAAQPRTELTSSIRSRLVVLPNR